MADTRMDMKIFEDAKLNFLSHIKQLILSYFVAAGKISHNDKKTAYVIVTKVGIDIFINPKRTDAHKDSWEGCFNIPKNGNINLYKSSVNSNESINKQVPGHHRAPEIGTGESSNIPNFQIIEDSTDLTSPCFVQPPSSGADQSSKSLPSPKMPKPIRQKFSYNLTFDCDKNCKLVILKSKRIESSCVDGCTITCIKEKNTDKHYKVTIEKEIIMGARKERRDIIKLSSPSFSASSPSSVPSSVPPLSAPSLYTSSSSSPSSLPSSVPPLSAPSLYTPSSSSPSSVPSSVPPLSAPSLYTPSSSSSSVPSSVPPLSAPSLYTPSSSSPCPDLLKSENVEVLIIDGKECYLNEVFIRGQMGPQNLQCKRYILCGKCVFEVDYYDFYIYGIVGVVSDQWPWHNGKVPVPPPFNEVTTYKDICEGISSVADFFKLFSSMITEGNFCNFDSYDKRSMQLCLAFGYSEVIRYFRTIEWNSLLLDYRYFFDSVPNLIKAITDHPMNAKGSFQYRKTGYAGKTSASSKKDKPFKDTLERIKKTFDGLNSMI